MPLNLRAPRDIASWMDSKNYPLLACYQGTIKGYSTAQFLQELKEVATHIANCSDSDNWNEINISRCIKGLKGMSVISEVQAVLIVLTEAIRKSSAELGAQAIGNALYGLQKMDASTQAIQNLLLALTDKIQQSSAELSAQAIGNALYGLQNMEANTPAVQKILIALTDKIQQSNAELNEQEIGNTLYGLQNMKASTQAVQNLLIALTDKIQKSSAPLDAQATGNALYGLHNMKASTPAVHNLLIALTDKIQRSNAELNAQNIGSALYGLHNMEASTPAVQNLLIALTDKIQRSNTELDAQAIGNALYGLHNMEASTPVVQNLLITLTDKIQQSKAELNAQAIGNALYGLQNINTSLHGELLNLLYSKHITSLSYESSPLEWSQCVAALLKLSKTNAVNLFNNPQCAQLLLPDNLVEPSLEQVTQLFITKLAAKHVKNNLLDLHGLDHLSAQQLLTDSALKNIDTIVFGKGSHSKSHHANTMKTMVQNYITHNNLQASWQHGRVKIKPPAYNPRLFSANQQPLIHSEKTPQQPLQAFFSAANKNGIRISSGTIEKKEFKTTFQR